MSTVRDQLDQHIFEFARLGQFQLAQTLARDRCETERLRHGIESVEYARALLSEGWVNYEKGNFARAVELCNQAATIVSRAIGEANEDFVTCISNSSRAMLDLGDIDITEPMLRKALSIAETIGLHGSIRVIVYSNMGRWHGIRGESEEAKKYFVKALRFRGCYFGKLSSTYAVGLTLLSYVYCLQRRWTEAQRQVERALAIFRVNNCEDSDFAQALSQLSVIRHHIGIAHESVALHRHALEILTVRRGENHPITLRISRQFMHLN